MEYGYGRIAFQRLPLQPHVSVIPYAARVLRSDRIGCDPGLGDELTVPMKKSWWYLDILPVCTSSFNLSLF